nr:SDR family NAD(P)-dependent oxidoreductase [Petropleomorpha daqingensis]
MVTGAARGLGRSHALALAARGMAVVVDDTGAELDGTGGDPAAAEAVAAEIRAAGGTAVATTADVATHDGAAAAVATALEEFGRLDALVANAGILRDRTFAKMTLEDFDAVVRVHLSAAAYCAKAAWPSLVASGTGRIVVTSSASGLYGQFGQANYAAAKMGLLGLVNVLKQEGARAGIGVNAIAPVAATRMTEPLLPPAALRGLAPELVSPLVAHLVSAECGESGLVLEVGGSRVARVQVVESDLEELPAGDDGIAAVVAKLAGIGTGTPFASSNDALARLLSIAADPR